MALFKPRTAQKDVDVTVLNPTVERVILDLPDGITNPNTPRFSEDGQSIYFGATPADGGRQEIYRISVDGNDVEYITAMCPPRSRRGCRESFPSRMVRGG